MSDRRLPLRTSDEVGLRVLLVGGDPPAGMTWVLGGDLLD